MSELEPAAPESGKFKTHHGLTAAFSMHLVNNGLFPAKPGRAIQRARTVRQIADYEAPPVPRDDAAENVRAAERFAATAAALVATAPSRLVRVNAVGRDKSRRKSRIFMGAVMVVVTRPP